MSPFLLILLCFALLSTSCPTWARLGGPDSTASYCTQIDGSLSISVFGNSGSSAVVSRPVDNDTLATFTNSMVVSFPSVPSSGVVSCSMGSVSSNNDTQTASFSVTFYQGIQQASASFSNDSDTTGGINDQATVSCSANTDYTLNWANNGNFTMDANICGSSLSLSVTNYSTPMNGLTCTLSLLADAEKDSPVEFEIKSQTGTGAISSSNFDSCSDFIPVSDDPANFDCSPVNHSSFLFLSFLVLFLHIFLI